MRKVIFFILLSMVLIVVNLYSQDISPKIYVLNPDVYHDWWLHAGRNYTIRWMTIGDIDRVNIKFSRDGGDHYVTIADNIENVEKFDWSVSSQDVTDNGIIRVEDSDNPEIYGTSKTENGFHILYFPEYSHIKFTLDVTSFLPESDILFICFNSPEKPIKMQNIAPHKWYAETDVFPIGSNVQYKYARNGACSSGDEYFENTDIGWRELSADSIEIYRNDTVTKWRWLPEDGNFPEIDMSGYLSQDPMATVNQNFMAGVMFTDWWRHEWIYSVDSTLENIKTKTNANWIEFSPVPEIVQFYPYPVIDIEGNNAISLEDLKKVIDKIHQHGFKVFLNPFAWAINVVDNSPSTHSEQWWNYFAEVWGKVLLAYAQIAQDRGVEMFGFRMWPSHYFNGENKDIVNLLAKNLLSEIKEVYKGKIAIAYDNIPGALDMDLFEQGDFLSLTLWPYYPWSLASSRDSGVEEIYQNLIYHLDHEVKELSDRYNKKIIFEQIAASSYLGSKINQPDFETVSQYFVDNEAVSFDFKGQADLYESYLKAISGRQFVSGAFSFGYFYWDSVDKTPSIRSKPAERVVSKWFKWIKGENDLSKPIIAFPVTLTSYPLGHGVEGYTIDIPSTRNVLFQPVLDVDREDMGKNVDLLIYVVSLDNSFPPLLFTQEDVTLEGDKIKFTYFESPIDFTSLAGSSFALYFGYRLDDGEIKYNLFRVHVN